MENLSQELVDNIVRFLDYNDLRSVLTLSPRFQIAAERCSGAFEKFNLNKDNAGMFLSRYSGHRVHYLRRIRFRPKLPALDSKEELELMGDEHPCRESAEELKQDDQHFTSQIQFLFDTLQKLESTLKDSQRRHLLNIKLTIYTPTRLVLDKAYYCRHRAYVSWRLHLLSPEELPTLNSVRELAFKTDKRYDPLSDDINQVEPSLRSLDLRIMLDLSCKMPSLERLQTRIGGEALQSYITWPSECAVQYRSGWDGPHRDSRIDFADAATTIQLPNLKHADLDFMFPFTAMDSMDQTRQIPNFAKEKNAIHDRFSSALRILSYPLRRLHVQGIVDTTLFQPSDSSHGAPFWPNLEVLNVSFHVASPSGAWYFRGLESELVTEGIDVDSRHYQSLIESPEDQAVDYQDDYPEWDMPSRRAFRITPVEETLEPFLSAFAKATTAMLSLKEAALWSPLFFNPDDMGGAYESYDSNDGSLFPFGELAWGTVYMSPRNPRKFHAPEGTEMSHARQIWWSVGNWRPSLELSRLVRGIGQHQHGGEVLEYWEHEQFKQGLGSRDGFHRLKGDVFGY